MKKLLILSAIALILASPCAFAQGTIQFANGSTSRVIAGPGVARILGVPDGSYVPAGNTTLRVGLYYALTENGTYSKAADTAFSATSAGRFAGGPTPIPGVAGGSAAWFQIRVWEQSYGADYESALSAGHQNGRPAIVGLSNTMRLTTGTITPTVMTGVLQPIELRVPEPSTYALVLLGLAGWFSFRRRS